MYTYIYICNNTYICNYVYTHTHTSYTDVFVYVQPYNQGKIAYQLQNGGYGGVGGV